MCSEGTKPRVKPGIGKGVLHLKEGFRRFTVQRFHPSSSLADRVDHLWTVAWDRCGKPPFVQALLPYPVVHAVLERGESMVTFPAEGRFERVLEGQGRVFGAKFRPGMFSLTRGADLIATVGRRRPFAEVFGLSSVQMETLEEEVLGAADPQSMAERYDRFLRSVAWPEDGEAMVARDLAETAQNEPSVLRVDALAARSGVSVRRIQRLFRRYIGLSPKWVLRRFRLHEVVEGLAQGESAAAIAAKLGYADQAHMSRDFKAAVGESPAEYARANR